MSTAKQDVEQLLQKLPDDCSVQDIQHHLYVLDKVRRGLEDARLTVRSRKMKSNLAWPMALRGVWSRRAIEDLEAIADFMATDLPT
jgi:hypothetical protein